jgi:hypothetical protein
MNSLRQISTIGCTLATIALSFTAQAGMLTPSTPPKSKEVTEILNCENRRVQVFAGSGAFNAGFLSVQINDNSISKFLSLDIQKCSEGFANDGFCVDKSGRGIIDGNGARTGQEFYWLDSWLTPRHAQDPRPLTAVVYSENGGLKIKIVRRHDLTYECTVSDSYGSCTDYAEHRSRRAEDEEVVNWLFTACQKST